MNAAPLVLIAGAGALAFLYLTDSSEAATIDEGDEEPAPDELELTADELDFRPERPLFFDEFDLAGELDFGSPFFADEVPAVMESSSSSGVTLAGLALRPWEIPVILQLAADAGIDARLLGALRVAENGPRVTAPDGSTVGGFGVIDFATFPEARTYEGNGRIASNTVKNTLRRYRTNVGREPVGPDGRATDDFLQYFSQGGQGYPGYAPLGAANDPTGLNANHLGNLVAYYRDAEVVTA